MSAQKPIPQSVHNVTDTDLPEGWAPTTLDELGHWTTGGTPSRKVKHYFGGSIPWVKSGDLNDGHVTETEERVTTAALENSAAKRLPPGTVSIALYGATIGKLGILDISAATNQACANCEVNEEVVDRRFLFHYLLRERQALIEAGQGGAQPNINNRIVREWPIPIAPLAEQKRIVEEVEELLTQFNAARDRLAKVPKILKRFRQSVLAAACSGRLTEEWRMEKGLDSDEWPQATLNQVSDMRLGKMLDKSKNVGTLTKYLRNLNVRWFSFDLSDLSLMRATQEEQDELALRDGDLCVCEGGEPGRCAVWNLGPTNIIFQKAIHRIRLGKDFSPDWVALCLKNDADAGVLEDYFTGSTIKHLTGRSLATYTFPSPPIHEQHEIVRRVEDLFKLADAIEKRVEVATKRADKLTEAILGKAFRGELVPTEAELARREGRTYEPASALLERIRAENRRVEGRHPARKNRKN